MARLLTALSVAAVAALVAPVARADVGFALHIEGAAAHEIGGRSSQFGWGASGLLAPELSVHRKVGVEVPFGVLGLSEGAHQDPAYLRSSSGSTFFALPGIRLRPLATPRRGFADALWLAAGAGIADTGGIVCPAVDARVGVDIPAGLLSLGPYLGFLEVFDPNPGALRHDGSVVLVGIHARWQKKAAPRPAPREGRDVVVRDADGTPDAFDTCPSGPPGADPCQDSEPVRVVERAELFRDVAERILFAYNSAKILPAGEPALRGIAQAIAEHDDYRLIQISGHADDRGGDHYNMRLSEARAAAVRDALVALGVDGDRLEISYYGNHHPRRAGRSEEARRQNRRVEFNVLKVRKEAVPLSRIDTGARQEPPKEARR